MKTVKYRLRPKIETFDQPTFWILWNPLSDLPPEQRFNNRAEADNIAAECSVKWNTPVFVMEAKACFERTDPPVKKITFG